MYPKLVKVLTIVLLLIAPSSVRAVVVPTGLNPGDEYHLAFLTAGKRDATAVLIETYNTFVQAEAALNSSDTGTDQGVQWFVIGSTGSVDARVNAVVSAPVYLLDGTTKVADGFIDIWDGTIENPIDIDQHLDISLNLVFAGSDPNGTKYSPGVPRFLGSTETVQLGDPTATDFEWIFDPGADDDTNERSFYALSELLTVVPEPTVGSLIAFGMLAVLWRRRRAPKR